MDSYPVLEDDAVVIEVAVRLLKGFVLQEKREDGLAEQLRAIGMLGDQLDDVFF